jgi:hypothetical protein
MNKHTSRLLALMLVPLITAGLLGSPAPRATAAPSVASRFGAVEAYRAPDQARAARLGWERIIFSWRAIQPGSADDWNGGYLPQEIIDGVTADGREVVGLLISTPAWASDGGRAVDVPRGLYLSPDDPGNAWAQFVRRMVTSQRDRIHTWIVWNEPDIWNAGDAGYQWAGSVADYYQLVKVASIAAKSADPAARISLAGLTYWWDAQYGKEPYLERLLQVASADPSAASPGRYFDIVALQLYNDPVGLYDIPRQTRAILARHGIDKPLWINETNVAPWDDPAAPLTRAHYRASQEEQAAYIIEATAAALAAGTERIAYYKMRDDPAYQPGTEPWGLVRSDGTERPAYEAVRVVTTYFDGIQRASLRYIGNVVEVRMDRPGETVTVAWNRGPVAKRHQIAASAPSARLVERTGRDTVVAAANGYYALDLPAATHNTVPGQPGRFLTGGGPLILVQSGSAGEPAATAEMPVVPTGPSWVAPTGLSVSGAWLAHFKASGDADTNGYPTTLPGVDSTTGQLTQCFQRSVLELHPEAPPAFRIQRRLLADIVYPGADPPVSAADAPPGDSTYFPLSTDRPTGLGHFVANQTRSGHPVYFKQFFDSHGGVTAFGFPKEEPKLRGNLWTQRFQAAVLEYHPEFDRDGMLPNSSTALRTYRVQLELIGDRYSEMSTACQR